MRFPEISIIICVALSRCLTAISSALITISDAIVGCMDQTFTMRDNKFYTTVRYIHS